MCGSPATSGRRRWWGCILVTAAGAALLPSRAGATQYGLIVLDPHGGEAYGVDAGAVVGADSSPAPTIWTNNGTTVTHLAEPAGFLGAIPVAVAGSQEVGWGVFTDKNPRAVLWNGPGSMPIDLSTGGAGLSKALATDGAQQVGFARGGAALWTGTAGSYVNLNPPTYIASEALGVWNGIQVGFGGQVPNTDALLWHGTADSYVVLKTGAEALGISRGQVVGFAGANGTNVAALWASATPQSFANLAPANTTASELFATNGVQQVGDVSLTLNGLGQLPIDHHPGVWHGTASSFQMLPLPQGDNYGFANGIDGEGNIVGVATTQSGGGVGSFIPVEWRPRLVAGDANFDGSVGFDDLVVLARNYDKPGEWVDGDFNGDGNVNFTDLVIVAQHYGTSQGAAETYSVQVQVPEPTALPMLSLAFIWAVVNRV